MHPKRKLRILVVLLLAPGLLILEPWKPNSSATTLTRGNRPNILMIVADDLGFSDLGSYGGEIHTPNLDRLATQGMRFTQFYNNAVCVVTRASMMTGLYPRFGSGGLLRSTMITIPELLRNAGYSTALTGKWHLGSQSPNRPTDRGFDEYYGVPSGCCNYFNPAQPDPRFYDGQGKRRPFVHNQQSVDQFPEDFYTTDAFTNHAVENIRRLATAGKPFFLNVCYTAPHFPLHAKPEDIIRYRDQYARGYFELRKQRYQRQLSLGIMNPRSQLSPPDAPAGPWTYDYAIQPWEKVDDPQREQRLMEVYAAMVDSLDRGVGQILKALDEAGIRDNTLVMFFSDNGGCASMPVDHKGYQAYNAGKTIGTKESYEFCGPGWGWAQNTPFRRYKAWTYEGGITTPLIVRWPGRIQPNSITHQAGHVIDLLPTFAELAETPCPRSFKGQSLLPLEGTSLWPVLNGKERGQPNLAWYLYGNRAIRQGQWKLVWGVTRGQWELYDLGADRTETRDLAARHPVRVRHLSEAWSQWAKRSEVSDKDLRSPASPN